MFYHPFTLKLADGRNFPIKDKLLKQHSFEALALVVSEETRSGNRSDLNSLIKMDCLYVYDMVNELLICLR